MPRKSIKDCATHRLIHNFVAVLKLTNILETKVRVLAKRSSLLVIISLLSLPDAGRW
jgi:hypothetical protein